MKITFNSPKNLKEKLKNLVWILGLNAFSLILFLIFIDIILGCAIFYNYVFLAENHEPQITENIVKFDFEAYQQVLEKLPAKEPDNEMLQKGNNALESLINNLTK
jgi:hypothetical protein